MSCLIHDKAVAITIRRHIWIACQKICLALSLLGMMRPLWQENDDVLSVNFMDYDMTYFDFESNKVQALENPFRPKVLGSMIGKTVNHVLSRNCKGCI